MAGLEVVVRPVVFPNIRPAPARALPPQDDPDKGFAVIRGNGAKQVSLSNSYSSSTSSSKRQETKRRVDEVRTYQKEDDGTINRSNYIDTDVVNKLWMKGGADPVVDNTGPFYLPPGQGFFTPTDKKTAIEFFTPAKEQDNIEIRKRNKIIAAGQVPGGLSTMTIVYVTTGAWGTGTGAPNSAAQVDGNFYDVDQRIVALNADLAEGKRIDTVTYTSNSMTFHFTDDTTQVIPLPVVTLQYVGAWTNSTPYTRGHLITGGGGFFQVLENHTTPALPAPFDPNATDVDDNPLYSLWMPIHDFNYDAAIFVPGSIQRTADELLFMGIANRPMQLAAGDEGAYARLDVANAVGATAIILSIEKNGTEIGTITIAAAAQDGVFSIPASTDFADGDSYALRVTQSDNAAPSGLSVTLPFVRSI